MLNDFVELKPGDTIIQNGSVVPEPADGDPLVPPNIVAPTRAVANPPAIFGMWRRLRCAMLSAEGSNSGVGQAAIQIARAMGLNSVNVIRDRDNFDETADRLSQCGATLGRLALRGSCSSACNYPTNSSADTDRLHGISLVCCSVLSETEARSKEGRARIAQLPPPSLALNCVGGKSAITLLRSLAQGGTMVT